MGFIKSEEILHKKIRMPGNIPKAVKIMDIIGKFEEDALQFIDLTSNDIEAKNNYFPLINRCNEILKKLNSFEQFGKDYGFNIQTYNNYFDFINDLEKDQNDKKLINTSQIHLNNQISNDEYFDTIEQEIIENYNKLNELIESYNKIKNDLINETERKMVLEKYFLLTASNINKNNIDNEEENIIPIGGVCDADLDIKIMRMLFRITKGRIIQTFFNTKYPNDIPQIKPKKIFILLVSQSEYLLNKINNIIDLYNCSKYNLPGNNINSAQEVIGDINKKIGEQKTYLYEAKDAIQKFLNEKILKEKNFSLYKLYFQKQKMIYLNLSKCIHRENFIDGEIWILSKYYEKIKRILNTDDESLSVNIIDINDYNLPKPTFIKTNDLTYPFQLIVNEYGIPTYGEINPGFFTVITFPFLFGIMFGDIGHGIIILFISIYFLLNSNYYKNLTGNNNEKNIFKYRYFFLISGIFSIFCGFMYNELFSIPINFFGSCYHQINNYSEYIKDDNCNYIFGLDPIILLSGNELTIVNSFKMKFSVIVGVVQMTFGILIKGVNDILFKNYLNFFFEFIPQIIFMIITFGYMLFMIFYKWLTDYTKETDKAPSIITIMINMIVKLGKIDGNPIWKESEISINQEKLNFNILLLSSILIPIMLFIKPLYLYYKKSKKNKKLLYQKDNGLLNNEQNPNNIFDDLNNNNSLNFSESSLEIIDKNAQFSHLFDEQRRKVKLRKEIEGNFSDIFINQLIYTIEFVLGTLSNTASYLRLWALSIAHKELSYVFMEKTFMDVIQEGNFTYGLNIFKVFIWFFVFINITVLILLFMDSIECALHTLRLHWVEFQNKFYKGDGYKFIPYNFRYLIEEFE